jgi:hypothetical protein
MCCCQVVVGVVATPQGINANKSQRATSCRAVAFTVLSFVVMVVETDMQFRRGGLSLPFGVARLVCRCQTPLSLVSAYGFRKVCSQLRQAG